MSQLEQPNQIFNLDYLFFLDVSTLFFFCGGKKFLPVTTLFPVFDSNCLRVFLAIFRPFLPVFFALRFPDSNR